MGEFRMPSLGTDMEAGTLIEWRVAPGTRVKRGDIVALVETQKGIVEVEIWTSGVIDRIEVQPHTKVPVGTVLAILREEAEATRRVAPAPVAAAPPPAPCAPVTAPPMANGLIAPVASATAEPRLPADLGDQFALRLQRVSSPESEGSISLRYEEPARTAPSRVTTSHTPSLRSQRSPTRLRRLR